MCTTSNIKSIRRVSKDTLDFIPVENIIKNMSSLEQYAESVINYTSKYNISFSISYAPDNLVGKYVKYPSYGDFSETYILRSYGKWWKQSEAYQKNYMPQDIDPLEAEDYVILGFKTAVVPRNVCIYETYNPGAVVRIWGRHTDYVWKLLWEADLKSWPPTDLKEEARKLQPKIRKVNCLINEIKIEFNQSHLKYHTSIDAVLLGGLEIHTNLPSKVLEKDLLKCIITHEAVTEEVLETNVIDVDHFSTLPYEVILHIFQYLDLLSLSRCAQVNKTWYEATLDPILYHNLSLKKYWHKVNPDTLVYFSQRCTGIKKLDLSWCGNHHSFKAALSQFLQTCGRNLTHLSLSHCYFVGTKLLKTISGCHEITELRLRNVRVGPAGFDSCSFLTKLITLDVCLTEITESALIAISKANPNLQHLILDFCENIERLDQVVEAVSQFNQKLTVWSSFKTTTLTSVGAIHFSKMANLRELDLGWCFVFSHPGDCLVKITNGCKHLKRLIISQWRGINDQMLLSVFSSCKDLTQLDLLGIKSISSDTIAKGLITLSQLRLLDISFCDSIPNELILKWRDEYPDVTIQRSCQYVVMDYLN